MTHRRTIGKRDLVRAAQINDAIAMEHGVTDEGAYEIGRELGIDIHDAAMMGAEHSMTCLNESYSKHQARTDIAHAFTMGVLTGLRAATMLERG